LTIGSQNRRAQRVGDDRRALPATPWLRTNRVMRVMLHTRWSAEAWSLVMIEFRKAVALRAIPQTTYYVLR
jgi:hypothetical protein